MSFRMVSNLVLTVGLFAGCSAENPSPAYGPTYVPSGDRAGGDNSVLPVCDTICDQGKVECRNNRVEQCVTAANCTQWQVLAACDAGQTCFDGQCLAQSCTNGDIVICEDRGVCQSGQRVCTNNTWGYCAWQVGPSQETCDGLDNDCDGSTDNNLAATPCAQQDGVCSGAHQRCDAASFTMVCDQSAYVEHAAVSGAIYQNGNETLCDNRDNDCDGQTDELKTSDPLNCGTCGHVCPTDPRGVASCVNNDCVLTCQEGYAACSEVCAQCPTIGVSSVACNGSSCRAASCESDYRLCNGDCAPCPTAGVATVACSGSACVALTCASTHRLCDGDCATCPQDGVAGLGCDAGSCVATACESGFYWANGSCFEWSHENVVELWEAEPISFHHFAIDTDSGNRPHLVFFDNTDATIKYASRNSGGWWFETIGAAGSNTVNDIVLDDDDVPHVSYQLDPNVMYAKRTGPNSWVLTPVTTGETARIALDSSNHPHIAYADNSSGDTVLGWASYNGATWDVQIIPGYTTSAWFPNPSPAITSTGTFMFSHYRAGYSHFVDVFTKTGGSWETVMVDSGADIGDFHRLRLDDNDVAHLVYTDFSNGLLMYATNRSGEWELETASDEPDRNGYFASLDLDPNGRPHSVHEDWFHDTVKYSVRTSAGWITDEITGSVCEMPVIAVDSAGYPHVVYQDVSNDLIRYAH